MMKVFTRSLIFIFVLGTLVLSACTGVAAPANSPAGDKVQAELVVFTGVIEAINGNQWTINGQVVTVDPAVVSNGSFKVGDTVKLEGQVVQDGSVVATRLETPPAPVVIVDTPTQSASVAETPTPAPATVAGGNSPAIVFDNSGSEAFGSVDSVTAGTVVIGGQTFTVTNSSEIKNQIQAGDFVKVHFALNADGTYSIIQIETWDPALVTNNNSNANSNSNVNSNSNGDDHGGNRNNNGNDNGNDHGGSDNGNGDDHGGNGNGG
jgi:hypothetical protein